MDDYLRLTPYIFAIVLAISVLIWAQFFKKTDNKHPRKH